MSTSFYLKVYRRQPSYCDKKESGEAGIAVSSVSCVHPRTGLLHRWLVTIFLGWHSRCHAGGCRRGQGMRGQGRSCNWNFVSTSPLKLRCHVIKLNSQHGNWSLNRFERWTFFHLTTSTSMSCVSLLLFQCLPYDFTSDTDTIPESRVPSFGGSATGLSVVQPLSLTDFPGLQRPWLTQLQAFKVQ